MYSVGSAISLRFETRIYQIPLVSGCCVPQQRSSCMRTRNFIRILWPLWINLLSSNLKRMLTMTLKTPQLATQQSYWHITCNAYDRGAKISQELQQNSGRHVGDMAVPYWRPKNITHHRTQFSGIGDKVPRVCAPLIYDIKSQNGWQCTQISSPPLIDLPISLYASHAIKSREDH